MPKNKSKQQSNQNNSQELKVVKLAKPVKLHKSYNYGCTFIGEYESTCTESVFFEKFKGMQEFIKECVEDLLYDCDYSLPEVSHLEKLKVEAKKIKDSETQAFFDTLIEQYKREKMLYVGLIKLTPENYRNLSLALLDSIIAITIEMNEEDNAQEQSERKYLIELINKYGIPSETINPKLK